MDDAFIEACGCSLKHEDIYHKGQPTGATRAGNAQWLALDAIIGDYEQGANL